MSTETASVAGSGSSLPSACEATSAGGLVYDWSKDTIVRPWGEPVPLPRRFVGVLRLLFQREPGIAKCCRSFAPFDEIGVEYYKGFLVSRKNRGVSRTQIAGDIRIFLSDPAKPKEGGINFRRDFVRWAKSRGLDGSNLIICDRACQCYRLGSAWKKDKPVVNRSGMAEACRYDDGLNYGQVRRYHEEQQSEMEEREERAEDQDADPS